MGDEATDDVREQLSLAGAVVTPRRRSTPLPSARQGGAVDPVALVLVDVGLPHLDRPFEYLVPDSMADLAVPGARVKVRFAGQDVGGYVLARAATADHDGTLAHIHKVVSPEAVLTPQVLTLAREIAHRYAGTLGDVVRLAVPPRHATAERNLPMEAPVSAGQGDLATVGRPQTPEPGPWADYPAGAPFLRHIAAGDAPAASWLALPGQPAGRDWPQAMAVAAATAMAAGRGALIVVPDHRDVDRVDAALQRLLGPGRHVRLTARQGPQARYTAWLKVLRGHVRCVVGTRAAMFAPVQDLGLVAWWDDGDDVLVEQRAPYPHVREVLRTRARLEGAALLTGGFTRTTRSSGGWRRGRCGRSAPSRPLAVWPRPGWSSPVRAATSSEMARLPGHTCPLPRGEQQRARWSTGRC